MVSIKLYDNKIILSNYTIIDIFVKEKFTIHILI